MNTTALPNTCHNELPTAVLKQSAGDFRVDEILGFELQGDGEHLWLNIRKVSQNTRDVVELLAKSVSLPEREIGYSGLKDKHAVTTQWFSVPTARLENKGNLPELLQQKLNQAEGLDWVKHEYGRKKLKTGTHSHNCFTVVLRHISAGRDLIDNRLQSVSMQGFPNYFGPQRFGRGGRNLHQAQALFAGRVKASRFKRGVYLSAARAHLFNRVLAERVLQGSWNKIVNGEVCMLDGNNSVFTCAQVETETTLRCTAMDIHPSGPLWGTGESSVAGDAGQLEALALVDEQGFCNGLESVGLKLQRRSLRAVAEQLQWHWLDDATVSVEFKLRRGVYATALLAEVFNIQDADSGAAQ